MRLSWNEVRAKAALFSQEWKEASRENEETQSFYNDFFEIFGVKRKSVAFYERAVSKLDKHQGRIDLFWPGVLLVEQKSAGRNLAQAMKQAEEYCFGLSDSEKPDYILVSDFQNFELCDIAARTSIAFTLDKLHEHVEAFGFIMGLQRREFKDQEPASIEAAELMGSIYDTLSDSGYEDPELESYLVRLVFCLFADDTGIFTPRDHFHEYIKTRTDGSNLGNILAEIFQTLKTPEDKRKRTIDEDLNQFPYINGDLFKEPLSIFSFNPGLRRKLITACEFDWSKISPAIFGALFQSVMNPKERREQGAHYTTEKNILKVIEPLFMDDLRDRFRQICSRRDRGRRTALKQFQMELGKLTFFDPACGCGNFLIIAYRELRLLEIDVLKEIYPGHIQGRQGELDVEIISEVDVDQFYGLEQGEFPVRIAETALWMMDHIMNNELSREFGHSYVRIPLARSPNIRICDALEEDWKRFLSSEKCSYVLGNPPFIGAKLQKPMQREQVRRIAALGGAGGTLDYVAAWFIKAGKYIQNSKASIGFVATNSVTQGEQADQLWTLLCQQLNLKIIFAHRTFVWTSDAKGKAHVHVAIIGLDLSNRAKQKKQLFSYSDIGGEPSEISCKEISPYLFDGSKLKNPILTVREQSKPINGMRQMIIGSQPIDDSNYIFTDNEREEFLRQEPEASQFLRPYIGAKEFLNNNSRWILALQEAEPSVLSKLKHVCKRIAEVRQYREKSRRSSTRELANTPTEYQVTTIPTSPFLVIPETSSEHREYVPIGWLAPPVIPSNSLRLLTDATLIDFALLTSAMHMAWMRAISGRLESRIRYSISVTYNTFPMPAGGIKGQTKIMKIERVARAVLEEREKHKATTLVALYKGESMPSKLRKAHKALDKAVDKLYTRKVMETDYDRLELLFSLYENMVIPLDVNATGKMR